MFNPEAGVRDSYCDVPEAEVEVRRFSQGDAMEVPGPDNDWRSLAFRQKVVAQIEDAMRKAGVAHSKTSNDMETHVFVKAKSRDEYLSLVARLIIHFRDIHKKTQGAAVDPMNALQTLTGIGPSGQTGMGMGPRPGGPPIGNLNGLGQMQMQQHVMPANTQPIAVSAQIQIQQMVQQQQQQQQQFSQFQAQQQQTALQQQQTAMIQQQRLKLLQQQQQQQQQAQNQQQQQNTQQILSSRMQQQQMAQLHQLQQQAQLQQQQQQHQGQAPSLQQQVHHVVHHQQQAQQNQPPPPAPQLPAHPQLAAQRMPMAQLNPQQQQQMIMMHQAQVVQQQAQLATPVGTQMMVQRPGMQIPPRPPRAPTAQANAGGMTAQQVPQVQPQPMMSSPSPVQVNTPQSMPPPPPQPQPSPQPPTSQPNSVSSGPTPSPSAFQPSPSPQPSQSPVPTRTPSYGVPSPSGPLNTPGNPGSALSPASASHTEEQQYLEKLKQLSKYIEPLRRMINKIDKNEDRKKDLSKMKSLLDILTDPSKRCPLRTLQKCEIALEKLKNDMAVPTPPPPPVPGPNKPYLCQPLLDAVISNIRSPVFNHSLYRTFSPAMTAIHGPPITGPSISSRKRKAEEDERQTIPNILQGEVARLHARFLVNLAPSHCSNSGTVHLICKLDDKNLPSVPPLQLSVPADYPEQSPQLADDVQQYDANPFLQTVHRNMTSKLLQLPDKHSVTALLNTWAQSVKQACLSPA